MRWHDVQIPFELRTADGRRMGEGRSPGIHLSRVLMFMEKALEDRPRSKSGQPANDMWAAFGFIFERWVEKALTEYYGFQRAIRVEQQELLCDGIYLTPDAINVEDGCYEEYKARWRSRAKWDGPDWERHFWKELAQVKAVCHVIGTTRARLVIFFVCGDWKPPCPHPPVCREFEFTEQELQHNWNVIVRHKQALERLIENGEEKL